MSNWVTELDLVDLAEAGDAMSYADKAKKIVGRLEKLRSIHWDVATKEGRDELVEEFRTLSEDPDVDEEEFNYVFANLYDWADWKLSGGSMPKAACWVKTQEHM